MRIETTGEGHASAVAEFVREVVRRDEHWLNMLVEDMITELVLLRTGGKPWRIEIDPQPIVLDPRGGMTTKAIKEMGLPIPDGLEWMRKR
jgi:hypothetical protein